MKSWKAKDVKITCFFYIKVQLKYFTTLIPLPFKTHLKCSNLKVGIVHYEILGMIVLVK